MKIIFIGPQASGKGTQAEILSKKLNLPHISMGDLLRSAKGELKKEIDLHINKGNLAPLNIIKQLLKQRLDQADTKSGFILDGFPRSSEQAELLKSITSIDKIILINISDKEAIKRISGRVNCEKCKANYNLKTSPKPKDPTKCDKCQGKLIQRKDDYEKAVKKRLDIYHNETTPLLDFYKDKLIKINGEQSIEKIGGDINKELSI